MLDNCEHLLAAAPLLTDLLMACSQVTMLTTSRAALRVRGERTFLVCPLPVPNLQQRRSLETLAEMAAVALFVQRAQAAKPDFALTATTAPTVAMICAQLDGLPLAIELAAARSVLLSPQALLSRLDRRLPFLIDGARDLPARQRTLRDTMTWSHDLLETEEQVLFRRLAVFVGGWTLEAAEAVCADAPVAPRDHAAAFDTPARLPKDAVLDLLGHLVNTSLVQVTEHEEQSRYGLLETVRDYALERLEASGETLEMRTRHLWWCLDLVEREQGELTGSAQRTSLERLEGEHDNLRVALEWALTTQDPHTEEAGDEGLRLAGALWRFWYTRGHLSEGRHWLEAALARKVRSSSLVRARALNGASVLTYLQGEYGRAVALLQESLALTRESGDRDGIASALRNMGTVAFLQAEYGRAAALFEESLALWRALGDRQGIALSLHSLGIIAERQGEYGRAAALLDGSLALMRELRDERGIAHALDNLGLVRYRQGEYGRAAVLLNEGLRRAHELGDKQGIAYALGNLGMVAYGQGAYERAAALHEETLALMRELRDERGIALSLNNLGWVALQQGAYARAATLHRESLVLSDDIGARDVLAEVLEGLVWAAAARGQEQCAARLGGAAEAAREALGVPLGPGFQVGHTQAVRTMSAALGAAEVSAIWAAGRALSLEEAIVEARGEPGQCAGSSY